LFSPSDILVAYREARERFKTGDIVLVASETDPSGFSAQARSSYAQDLKRKMAGKKIPFFAEALVQSSAHSIVQLPVEGDAMWLVVTRGKDIPAMVVIFATPYEVAAS